MKVTHKEANNDEISPIYTSLKILWYVVPCNIMLKLITKMLTIWKFGTLVQTVMNGNEIVSVFQKYLSHFLQNIRFKWKGFGTSVVAAVLFLVLNCFSFSFVL